MSSFIRGIYISHTNGKYFPHGSKYTPQHFLFPSPRNVMYICLSQLPFNILNLVLFQIF